MDKKNKFYHYVILREDLPTGTALAQCIHAAGESNPNGLSSYAVALSATKEQLYEIETKLKICNIKHASICEPDPPYNGELVSIGINPQIRSENKDLRSIVSRLKLCR